jgi:hypothetical protein
MFEAPTIIGTCINCIAPGSSSATLALVLIGVGVVLTAERRKLARARSQLISSRWRSLIARSNANNGRGNQPQVAFDLRVSA